MMVSNAQQLKDKYNSSALNSFAEKIDIIGFPDDDISLCSDPSSVALTWDENVFGKTIVYLGHKYVIIKKILKEVQEKEFLEYKRNVFFVYEDNRLTEIKNPFIIGA